MIFFGPSLIKDLKAAPVFVIQLFGIPQALKESMLLALKLYMFFKEITFISDSHDSFFLEKSCIAEIFFIKKCTDTLKKVFTVYHISVVLCA
jgi:hypothetical protein